MNQFLAASIRLIASHGVSVTYKTIVRTVNEVDSTVTETPTSYTVKMYPKHILANQFNYPTLVGKDVVKFYLANNSLSFIPKVNDTITYDGLTYKIQSIQETAANGQIVLYRILSVKG